MNHTSMRPPNKHSVQQLSPDRPDFRIPAPPRVRAANLGWLLVMSKRHQKNVERQLIDIVNLSGNDNKCGECGASYPTWASWNLGILLCGRCASVHRRVLPPDVSKVKSLTLDTWTNEQIERIRRVGNRRARKRWNPKRIPFPQGDDDDTGPMEDYVRDKYVNGRFRDGDIDESDYNDRASRFSESPDEYGGSSRSRLNLTLTNRSRAQSVNGPLPTLSHRKMTTFESKQYPSQTTKITGFGYTNRDLVIEALILANGSIDTALDILDRDSRINPEGHELAPKLPSRPQSRPAALETTASSSQALNDWWKNSAPSAPSAQNSAPASAAGPQIYQYTDPITGQVSYVDANGQEYLDTNNPQHQQLLAQQTNPQLIAQQTNKQNILSLYNQPTNQQQLLQQLLQFPQQSQFQQQAPFQQQFQTGAGQQPQFQQQFTQQFAQQPQFTQYAQASYMQQPQVFQATGQFQGYRQ